MRSILISILKAISKLNKLERENERYRQALEFYAAEKNWRSQPWGRGHWEKGTAYEDRGLKAIRALQNK